ncbi:MAG: hypothetical protein WKF40_04345, partial [Thermoleophilaceae bacterium]
MPIEKPPSTVRSGVDAGSLPQLVVEGGERGVGGVEGLGVGAADLLDHVPVVAGRAGKGERRARRDHVQAAPGVQDVGQAEQVVLVRAAAVVEDEEAGGVAVGRALAVGQLVHGPYNYPVRLAQAHAPLPLPLSSAGPYNHRSPGRVAQWESARFTRERS